MAGRKRREKDSSEPEGVPAAPDVPFDAVDPGETNAISLDVSRLMSSRMLVQGVSGAGKSYLVRYVLESSFDAVQQFVLDPEGEFATLREEFPYVLASASEDVGRDVEAHPETAAALCERLVSLGASCVFDLYDLSLSDRRLFVRNFIERLMSLDRSGRNAPRRPVLVAIGEVHRFAPERGSGDSSATDSIITLASQGRKRGFSLLCDTQRLSKLHKDVAAELLNVFVGLTNVDVDVRRATDLLGFDTGGKARLRNLEPGQFFAYGPAVRDGDGRQVPVTLVRSRETRTTHPGPDAMNRSAPVPAPQEVKKLLSELTEAVTPPKVLPDEPVSEGLTGNARKGMKKSGTRPQERAPGDRKPDGDIVRELERRDREIERLKARLESETARADRAAREVQESRAALASLRVDVEAMTEAATGMMSKIVEATAEATARRDDDAASKDTPPDRRSPSPAPASKKSTPPATPKKTDALRPPDVVGDAPAPASYIEGTELSKGAGRILAALSDFRRRGLDSVDRGNLAVAAGQSPKSSAYAAYVTETVGAGLADYPAPGRVGLTPNGLDLLGDGAPPLSGASLRESWYAYLPTGQERVLRELVEAYPGALDREALSERAGQSSKSSAYAANISTLVKLGLARYPGSGLVAATDKIFEGE